MTSKTETELLREINKAVAAANEAEQVVKTAKTELVSRSKTVGLLLLEAKKLHPAVKDFEAFLKPVDGLKLSRAFDCMRIAGGRITDEELKKDTRESVQKHRVKKKLKLATPEPVSVTSPPVTESAAESPEASAEKRKAENADLDKPTAPIDPYYEPQAFDEPSTAVLRASIKALREFKFAADTWLPKIREDMRMEAIVYVRDFFSKTKKVA